ncbi:uncharacterized protein OCT59_020998 [Rhizophagus irregularis]|uniref:uncharacterized protein n=1 Tax=Rhizophagus irregularis TaxID=588596 RepID=UPI0019F56F27|nr:hypothetical protein OCT59_020998 [Rhizophagus irregularis]GBC26904.2 hypothetical protein GLOIN_2v1763967 [Rhizophagus irregularis DAOM 181602=DAOM 197198]CAG8655916.1 16199_t:CDS:1 [Rhizophagus irregularis]
MSTTLKTLANLTHKLRFRGSISYKNKKQNEIIRKLVITNNLKATFRKDKGNVSHLFFVNRKEENIKLHDLVVINSTNGTLVKGNHYPTKTGPYSYKINQALDYRVYLQNNHILSLSSQNRQVVFSM